MQVNPLGVAKYYVTCINDATGFCYVYFLRHKNEVFEKFEVHENIVSNNFGKTIIIVRSNNGGEYKNEDMEKYLQGKG
ncbi:hypothetical protein DD594_27315, partial [Enterobacter cloacae complex sp. 4DZ1-17B1]